MKKVAILIIALIAICGTHLVLVSNYGDNYVEDFEREFEPQELKDSREYASHIFMKFGGWFGGES